MSKLFPPALDPARVPERSGRAALYLEVGDRTPGDGATDSDVDLAARLLEGQWVFTRKDGSPHQR